MKPSLTLMLNIMPVQKDRSRAQVRGALSQHKNPPPIPMAIMQGIKPIYKDISVTDLLKRCLKGRTQCE